MSNVTKRLPRGLSGKTSNSTVGIVGRSSARVRAHASGCFREIRPSGRTFTADPVHRHARDDALGRCRNPLPTKWYGVPAACPGALYSAGEMPGSDNNHGGCSRWPKIWSRVLGLSREQVDTGTKSGCSPNRPSFRTRDGAGGYRRAILNAGGSTATRTSSMDDLPEGEAMRFMERPTDGSGCGGRSPHGRDRIRTAPGLRPVCDSAWPRDAVSH